MAQGITIPAPQILIEEQFQLEPPTEDGGIIPIAMYRKFTGDYTSTDVRIIERLQYLEQFCRVIAQTELDKHVAKTRNKTQKAA